MHFIRHLETFNTLRPKGFCCQPLCSFPLRKPFLSAMQKGLTKSWKPLAGMFYRWAYCPQGENITWSNASPQPLPSLKVNFLFCRESKVNKTSELIVFFADDLAGKWKLAFLRLLQNTPRSHTCPFALAKGPTQNIPTVMNTLEDSCLSSAASPRILPKDIG